MFDFFSFSFSTSLSLSQSLLISMKNHETYAKKTRNEQTTEKEKKKRNRKTTKTKHGRWRKNICRYQIRMKGRIVCTHTTLKWGDSGSLVSENAMFYCVTILKTPETMVHFSYKKKYTHNCCSTVLCFVRLRSSWNWSKLKGRTVCLCHLQMAGRQAGWLTDWLVFCAPFFCHRLCFDNPSSSIMKQNKEKKIPTFT